MFSRLSSDLVELCSNVPDVCYTDSISLKSTVANVAVEAVGLMRYPSAHPVSSTSHATLFAMMHAGLR